jgi:hypothetical protein
MFYNRSVNNVSNVNVTNVYNKTVINDVTVNRVSYNGGNGVQARPTPQELAIARAPHVEATPAQRQQVTQARSNPALRLSANHGQPAIAATPRAGAFTGAGVVGAKAAGRPGEVRQSPAPRANAAPREAAPQRTAPAERAAPHERAAPAERSAAPAERAAPHERPAPAAPRPAAHPERPAEHEPHDR